MEYGEISGQVKVKSSDLTTSANSIENVSLGSVWSGAAYETLSGYLRIAVNKLWIEIGNLNTFIGALNQLEKYKSNKEKIASLTAQMNSLPDDEEYDGQRAALAQQIKTFVAENEILRASITSALSSISATSSELNPVTFSFGTTNYLITLVFLIDSYLMKIEYDESLRLSSHHTCIHLKYTF